ncbi:MAG TPA: PqiC family protein [Burkholderiales bacterium]|nr:PqiC family protein [Burkholderiales bacterium]
MRRLLLVLVLTACATPPRESFYTLNAPEPPAAAADAPSIAVGPVVIPEIVDRPQIVVRLGPNQVQIMEQARWAEPLKAGIARVVAANLAITLGARLAAGRNAGADYRVALDIQRFESPADAVLIEALWTVTSKDGRQSGRSVARQPIAANDYSSLAAAHSAALAAISKDIAAAIKP